MQVQPDGRYVWAEYNRVQRYNGGSEVEKGSTHTKTKRRRVPIFPTMEPEEGSIVGFAHRGTREGLVVGFTVPPHGGGALTVGDVVGIIVGLHVTP